MIHNLLKEKHETIQGPIKTRNGYETKWLHRYDKGSKKYQMKLCSPSRFKLGKRNNFQLI